MPTLLFCAFLNVFFYWQRDHNLFNRLVFCATSTGFNRPIIYSLCNFGFLGRNFGVIKTAGDFFVMCNFALQIFNLFENL